MPRSGGDRRLSTRVHKWGTYFGDTDDTGQLARGSAAFLPEGQREAHFSSAESGVKHAYKLKTLHIPSGRACLTPDSAEEKAKAGEPLASLHTDSTLVDPCHPCPSVSKKFLTSLM